MKTEKNEDLKLNTEEKKESLENQKEKVDEKMSDDKDSTLVNKEVEEDEKEEEKPQKSTAAVEVAEQDLKNVANNVLTDSAGESKEETIAKKEEEIAVIEKPEEDTNNVESCEKAAEIEETVKTEVKEEPPRNFREKFDISTDDIKEDDQEIGEDGVESLEDITDAVMSMRHERGLIEERRKFQTYLKFPWTTRSRANRRGDSRAESSGANTPDPTSPAPIPSHLVGGEQESIPSPATTLALSAPTTPFTPLDSATPDALHEPFAAFDNKKHRNNNNRKRCRTTSSKKDQERRSTSPDTREIILPYEPLKFPLNDLEFDEMQYLMPIEKPPEIKPQESNNIRKPLGSYGRGRNGVRRQGHNSSNSLIRSLRPRISNRPYVMDTKDMSESGGFVDSFEQKISSSAQQTLHLTDNSYMIGDNAEETEDETETCGLAGITTKDDLYTDDDDDDDEDDDDLDEDEDDGFPRNPLATADDNIMAHAANVPEEVEKGHCNSDVVDSAYAAYVGHSDMFSDCEMDSSDPEPFKDDDPNDPEWNGEPRRSSRM